MGESLPPRKSVPLSEPDRGLLHTLYHTVPGRCLLKALIRPGISKAVGRLLDTRLSAWAVPRFIRRHQLDMTPYESVDYRSYNAFFTRRIRPEYRPIDREPTHLISPCDAKLTAYPITPDCRFSIKGSSYTVGELLENDTLAADYANGCCLIFRLSVDDYHRYIYFDDGTAEASRYIRGVLHTVQPIALEHGHIYKRNCREYTVLHTAHFGSAVQIEVGALMVGRICNNHVNRFTRGEEKGRFEFGGSTIVVLLRPDVAIIDEDILKNTADNRETIVRMGERIGKQR